MRLTVLRQGESTERFEVSIVRDKIDLEEQAAKLRFEDARGRGRKLEARRARAAVLLRRRDPSKRQGSRDVERS